MNIIGYITILVTCIIIWILYRKAIQEEIYINIETGKIISKELALQKLYEYLVVANAIKLKGELHE